MLVTVGVRFFVSNFFLDWIDLEKDLVINLDKQITYAGNLENLSFLERNPRYAFIRGDIGDADMPELDFCEICRPRRLFYPQLVLGGV